MADSVPQLLTLDSVARALSVSPHTVRSFVRKGRLQPIRICRRLLFSREELSRFLAEAK
jgi:excisionase family DNA binding protein